jgi:hypothetical protein
MEHGGMLVCILSGSVNVSFVQMANGFRVYRRGRYEDEL